MHQYKCRIIGFSAAHGVCLHEEGRQPDRIISWMHVLRWGWDGIHSVCHNLLVYMIYGFMLGGAINKYWVLFEDLNARIWYLDKDK